MFRLLFLSKRYLSSLDSKTQFSLETIQEDLLLFLDGILPRT